MQRITRLEIDLACITTKITKEENNPLNFGRFSNPAIHSSCPPSKIGSLMHWATVEEAMAKASPSFPLTGKDKARGDGSLRRHPYPDLSPSRGKELEQDLPLPFSFAVGVRELMNTLRDKSQNYYRTEFQSWILD